MAKKLTGEIKDEVINLLHEGQAKADEAYRVLHRCGVEDEKIDTLASLTCDFDDAVGEVEDLSVKE